MGTERKDSRDEAALQILAAAIAGLAAKVNAPSFDLQDEASVDAFGRWVIDVLRRVNERMVAPSGVVTDTERLDWLERQIPTASSGGYRLRSWREAADAPRYYLVGDSIIIDDDHFSLREAIDAAIMRHHETPA